MRPKSITFVGLGILGIAIAAGAIALVAADLGRAKSQIIESVERATGLTLVVGELTLNILPVPTVSIKNAVLGNAAWGNAPQLAKVGEISARLALLPLLFGQHVRVTRLRMSDVDLFLETDAHGRGNWAFGDMTGKSPGQASPLPGGTAEPQPIIAGDIEVDDMAISYRDSRGAAVSRVSLDSIKLTGNATSTAFSFGLKIDGNGLAASPVAASERLSSVEYHLAATVSGDPEGSIQLKSIHGSFGPSSFDGEASVVLTGPRPTLTAKFDVPMIDLTQNQTIDQTAPAGPTAKSGQDRLFAGDPLILPLDALAPFDGDLILNVVTVKFRHATLDHIVAHATLTDGNLQIAPFSLDIGEGHVVGKVGISTSQAPPTIAVDITGKNIDVGKFVAAITSDDLLDGKGDLTVALRGKGESMSAIMASLDGDSVLIVGRGVIKHEFVDLIGADVFRDAFAMNQGKQTATLNCMVARFDVQKGLATAHGLLMDTPDVTLSGHGAVNLGTERIDLEMTPRPKRPGLLDLPVTVDIGGTLAHPTAESNKVLIAKDVAVDVASGVVSPALILAPMLLGSGGDQNPCLLAVGRASARASSTGAGQHDGSPADAIGAVGTALDDIGRSIDKFLAK
jgi:uncharacterized protein involved in outer membrane biogenesis